MASPAFALTTALIWAVSPIYYRGFLAKFDFLSLNLLRTCLATLVLSVPAMYYWSDSGLTFALLSGVFTLAFGDSLFLISLRRIGAATATPVAFTYVLMIQLIGPALGQTIPYGYFVSALMVVVGVYVLSRGGGGGEPRPRGIALALASGVFWTIGEELVQASTNAGGNFVVVSFASRAAAAFVIGAAFFLTRRSRVWPDSLPKKEIGFMLALIVFDLVLASTLFVYSVSTIGVALTVILTSLAPALTQVFAKALGKESPSIKDFAGGALIVAALVVAMVV